MRQILTGVMALMDLKNWKFRVSAHNLTLNGWISLKFIWYITVVKMKLEFEMGDFALILTGVYDLMIRCL